MGLLKYMKYGKIKSEQFYLHKSMEHCKINFNLQNSMRQITYSPTHSYLKWYHETTAMRKLKSPLRHRRAFLEPKTLKRLL